MSTVWFVLAIVMILAYMVLMSIMLKGWFKLDRTTIKTIKEKLSVSVLIPFRNEADSLPDILSELSKQNYPENLREFIFVNDHSKDNSTEIIKTHQINNPGFKLIDSPNDISGKKRALQHGLSFCHGEIILLTDSDCRMQPQWINHMVEPFSDKDCILCQGPVLLSPANSFIAKLQQIEFLSLMTSAAGSIASEMAILASGANLAVRKNFYLNAASRLKDHINTGDDMFLLEQAKKTKDTIITYCKQTEAIVQTPAIIKISQLWNQRKRWSSKALNYQDPAITIIASLVFSLNLLILIALGFVIFGSLPFYYPAGLWLLKALAEFPLLYSGCRFYQIPGSIYWFFPAQLIYPFYVVFVAIGGILGSFSWKER
ncbi:MAG: glycosyltransferase [Bacteroidales bacterium]|nr:glycosyltransferase [Bacteroidales bacterium]